MLVLAAPADWVPARWTWTDPATLDLLQGTPVNCLLLKWNSEQSQALSTFSERAAERHIATLAIIEPKQRLELARKIARGGMTVRQVERFATRSSKAKADSPNASVDPNTKWALEELQRKFGFEPERVDEVAKELLARK